MLRFLRNSIVATMGGMCYSIYLFHNLIMEVVIERGVARIWEGETVAVVLFRVALGFTLVMMICVAPFVLLERPFMDPAWPGVLRHWLARRVQWMRHLMA